MASAGLVSSPALLRRIQASDWEKLLLVLLLLLLLWLDRPARHQKGNHPGC
jgi:hypothetical protein